MIENFTVENNGKTYQCQSIIEGSVKFRQKIVVNELGSKYDNTLYDSSLTESMIPMAKIIAIEIIKENSPHSKSKMHSENISSPIDSRTSRFRFRQRDKIGVNSAEEDEQYLKECFIETGDYEALVDLNNPARILLGRTGSGKTAILKMIAEKEERVIIISPEDLSLNYIANSDIIKFFSEIGFNLNPFYKLLWRHVFSIEILQKHFNMNKPNHQRPLIDQLFDIFKSPQHKKALDYLKKWGDKFWEDTETRIKEITSTLETELKATVKGESKPVSGDLGSTSKLKEEEKKEIINRAKHVISESHASQLNSILDILNGLLNDKQKKYYILIDDLDRQWVQNDIRYSLIRALIETSKDFRQVKNVKVIIALRYDLMEDVFEKTRDVGFQEEKYTDMILDLKWTKSRMLELIDKRINKLIQSRYSGSQSVSLRDLVPKSISNNKSGVDYIIERTLMRPRDIIDFVNRCIEGASDKINITSEIIRSSENEYSHNRLRALGFEWASIYPNLDTFTDMLRNYPSNFSYFNIDTDKINEQCLYKSISGFTEKDILSKYCDEVIQYKGNEDSSLETFIKIYLCVMYKTGIIGIQLDGYQSILWSHSDRRLIKPAEINHNTHFYISPCFWMVLSTQKPNKNV